MVAVVHHIAADGLSQQPLVTDLGVAYVSRCAGAAPGWKPLPVQYVDYTLWQRRQLGEFDAPDSAVTAQLDHWADALAGMPERVDLPTDRPIRRWLTRVATECWWTGRPSPQHGFHRWRASTTRPASWWCRLPWPCR